MLAPQVSSILRGIDAHLHDHTSTSPIEDSRVHLFAPRPVEYPASRWRRSHGFMTRLRRRLLARRLAPIPDPARPWRRQMTPRDAERWAVLIAATLGIDGVGRPGNGGGTAGYQPSQSAGQEQLSGTPASEPVSSHAILGVGEWLFRAAICRPMSERES